MHTPHWAGCVNWCHPMISVSGQLHQSPQVSILRGKRLSGFSSKMGVVNSVVMPRNIDPSVKKSVSLKQLACCRNLHEKLTIWQNNSGTKGCLVHKVCHQKLCLFMKDFTILPLENALSKLQFFESTNDFVKYYVPWKLSVLPNLLLDEPE